MAEVELLIESVKALKTQLLSELKEVRELVRKNHARVKKDMNQMGEDISDLRGDVNRMIEDSEENRNDDAIGELESRLEELENRVDVLEDGEDEGESLGSDDTEDSDDGFGHTIVPRTVCKVSDKASKKALKSTPSSPRASKKTKYVSSPSGWSSSSIEVREGEEEEM